MRALKPLGAIIAPVVGIAGPTTAMPMAVVIAFLGISALTTFVLLCRSSATGAGPTTSSGGAKTEQPL